MRYIVALAVAAALIIGCEVLVRSTYREIESNFERQRQQLKEQKANGTLPDQWKDVDLDNMKWTEFSMQVSQNTQMKLDFSAWWVDFWYVLATLIVAVCLGGAYLWGRIFAHRTG